MMKHDASKYCKVQFNKTFGKTFLFRTEGNSETGGEQFSLS